MSTSAGGEGSDLSSKDRGVGFFSLGRRNFFSSNDYIAEIPKMDRRRSFLQKSLSQANLLPQSFEHYYKKPIPRKQWNQPTGLVSQILQEKRDVLIENLKQKVKILAEESVTRNFIHEQSSNITAFCAAVDDCLRFGLILKKPVLFNREPPTYILLKEVAKSLPEARDVVRRVQRMEEGASGFGGYGHAFSLSSPSYADSLRRNMSPASGALPKHLWIRIALFQKSLSKIVDYLVENAESHYERVSIIAHPFDSQLFADLLRGPCTHDYTRIRTSDHLWTDPSAGELMQRKMIYSAGVQHQQQSGTVQKGTIMAAQKQPDGGKASTHFRSRLLPRSRLSLDMGVGAISTGHSQPSRVDTPGISLHFESDVISPASLLYQVSPSSPIIRPSKRDSISEATSDESQTSEEVTLDNLATEESRAHHFHHHHSHSVFSPSLPVQKLTQAKDYVESLHQNERTPLLYGKNNVIVQPSMSTTRISGYLSMHKTGLGDNSGLELKWAPNRAMSVPQENDEQQQQRKNQRPQSSPRSYSSDEDPSKLMLHESSYWDFALDIDIKKVVYIHCHRHHSDTDSGTVILVRADGVQYPPLTFPAFSQVVSFIQCLETHLAPKASLNPRTADIDWDENSDPSKSVPSSISAGAYSVTLSSPSSLTPTQFCFLIDRFDAPSAPKQESAFRLFTSTLRDSMQGRTLSMENLAAIGRPGTPGENLPRVPINAMDAFSTTYQTMQHQILSRVFHGWLAYTRSVNLIRNRLKNVVYPSYLVSKPPSLNAKPLTTKLWRIVRHSGGKNKLVRKLYERIYFGGCDPALRQEVWPFLLNHYPWSATSAEIEEIDRRTRMAYERSVSEWLAAEVIILQQEQQQRQRASVAEAVAGQSTPAVGSHRISIRRPSLVSDKQTVEDMLSDAWNRVKRRISTVAAPSSKHTGEVNGNSDGSHITTSSTRTSNRLPPLPPKWTHESRASKINSGVIDIGCSSCDNSFDLTDDATEECTLTTTDDDDAVDSTAAANRVRRLAIARAQSCPNTPPSLNYHAVTIRNTNSSAITQEDNSDIDEVFSPLSLPLKRTNGQIPRTPAQLPREKKHGWYSHSETSGASYSSEVLEALSVNIQRIDKDVARCDRNYHYFSKAGIFNADDTQTAVSEQSMGGLCVASLDLSANLYRLRTIMCTWIWQHMETGYVQGMCDLLAPLLVVLEDEALTYACFSQLMLRMLSKFPLASGTIFTSAEAAAATGVVLPHLLEPVVFERAPHRSYEFTRPKTKQQLVQEANHHAMNGHTTQPNVSILVPTGSTLINQQFESLRGLIEVLDPVLAEHMHLNEDNSHLYFYRWLLLDFKRELKYADVFLAWETIWTSYRLVCPDFEIFIAFALIQYYRDIIIFYCSDYTDIIRFYNERAEQHDLSKLLGFARDLIYRLQLLISSLSSGPEPCPKALPKGH